MKLVERKSRCTSRAMYRVQDRGAVQDSCAGTGVQCRIAVQGQGCSARIAVQGQK